jgi:ABC-type multidrug transport system ATPase subunit
VRKEIGFISHQPALIDELTLEENLVHFARLSGVHDGSVGKALGVVGLDRSAGRRVVDSSHGMKRRLEVAWLLIRKPRLLLLDEAKSGLDGPAQDLIDALVSLTVGRGGAVASVSHDRQHLAGVEFTTTYHITNGRLRAQR